MPGTSGREPGRAGGRTNPATIRRVPAGWSTNQQAVRWTHAASERAHTVISPQEARGRHPMVTRKNPSRLGSQPSDRWVRSEPREDDSEPREDDSLRRYAVRSTDSAELWRANIVGRGPVVQRAGGQFDHAEANENEPVCSTPITDGSDELRSGCEIVRVITIERAEPERNARPERTEERTTYRVLRN